MVAINSHILQEILNKKYKSIKFVHTAGDPNAITTLYPSLILKLVRAVAPTNPPAPQSYFIYTSNIYYSFFKTSIYLVSLVIICKVFLIETKLLVG